MKVAIVHDWFVNPGGAEKVTRQLISLYPDADVFSLMDFLSPEDRTKFVDNRTISTSKIQHLPFVGKYYRFLFPVFPKLITKFALEKYDLVISSSHSIAKGVQTHADQTHICYIHTPVRYAWDLRKQYLIQIKNSRLRSVLGKQLEKLQKWDFESSKNVDFFISNSKNVADRVKKNYNRDSSVIYPPVDIKFFTPSNSGTKKNYFLVVSRLVFYKRIDLVIKAFAQLPHFELIVAGNGPQKKVLQKSASPNVTFLGHVTDNELKTYIQEARATIFAANEDFGISPVESQAAGTPVIALNRGGYKETIIPNVTGVLYDNQTTNSLVDGINTFVANEKSFKPEVIQQNSIRFGTQRFIDEITNFVNDKMAQKSK